MEGPDLIRPARLRGVPRALHEAVVYPSRSRESADSMCRRVSASARPGSPPSIGRGDALVLVEVRAEPVGLLGLQLVDRLGEPRHPEGLGEPDQVVVPGGSGQREVERSTRCVGAAGARLAR